MSSKIKRRAMSLAVNTDKAYKPFGKVMDDLLRLADWSRVALSYTTAWARVHLQLQCVCVCVRLWSILVVLSLAIKREELRHERKSSTARALSSTSRVTAKPPFLWRGASELLCHSHLLFIFCNHGRADSAWLFSLWP